MIKKKNPSGNPIEPKILEFYFKLLSAFTVIVVCIANTGSSLENNKSIVLATAALIFSSSYLGHPKERTSRLTLLLAMSIIAWMLASNSLAIYMGIEPARWSRFFDGAVQITAILSLAAALRHRPELTIFLIYGIFIAFAFNTILLILAWSTLENPQSHNWVWDLPNFVNIRFFSSFMMVVACVSIWGALFYKRKLRLFFFFTFLLSLAQIFWSGSRSSVISLLIASIVVFIIVGASYWKRWIQLLIVVALAALLAAQFPVDSSQLGVERALGFGTKFISTADSIDELSSGRIALWKDALHWIMQKPIFGWGGDYYREVSIHSNIAQVHNGPLQIAIEWGTPLSLFIYLFFAFVLLKCSRFFYREKSVSTTFSLGYFLFMTMLFHSFLDGVFYHGAMLFFMMMAMAFLISEPPLRSCARTN